MLEAPARSWIDAVSRVLRRVGMKLRRSPNLLVHVFPSAFFRPAPHSPRRAVVRQHHDTYRPPLTLGCRGSAHDKSHRMRRADDRTDYEAGLNPWQNVSKPEEQTITNTTPVRI